MTALDAGDPAVVVRVLERVSERERKALWPIAREHRPRHRYAGPAAEIAAATVAVFGCAPGPTQVLRALNEVTNEAQPEHIVAVLVDRSPTWLTELATALLESQFWLGREMWPVVRELVRVNAIPRPKTPQYVIKMVEYLGWLDLRRPPLRALLLDDPGLLEEEVYLLFDVNAGAALAEVDRHWDRDTAAYRRARREPQLPQHRGIWSREPEPERTWRETLLAFAEEGRLERARLLDGTLRSFLHGWPARELGWYVRFHDALKASLEEIADREPLYLEVMSSTPSVAIAVAQRAAAQLQKRRRLNHDALLAASRWPLDRAEKAIVGAQLKLLDRVACEDRQHVDAVVRLAAHMFRHERADVQEAALALVERHLDATSGDVRAAVEKASEALAPSLRGVASDTFGAARPPEPPPRRAWTPLSAPVLRPPLIDLDDLGESLETAFWGSITPLEFERLLGGLVRLAFTIEEDRLAGTLTPIVERLFEEIGIDPTWDHPPAGGGWLDTPRPALRNVLLAVHRRIAPETYPERVAARLEFSGPGHIMSFVRTPSVILYARLWEIADRLARRVPGQLLAEPTATDGSIDPAILVERIAEAEREENEPGPIDLRQALLRIGEPGREEALRAAAKLRSQAGEAIRTTLKSGLPDYSIERMLGPAPRAVGWRTGSRSPRRVQRVAVAEVEARDWRRESSIIDPTDVLLGLKNPLSTFAGRSVQGPAESAHWPLTAPTAADLIAAHALPILNRALEPVQHGADPLLAWLARPTTPLAPTAHTALALGLAAADAQTRGLAVEALGAAVATDRLDPARLGIELADLLTEEIVLAGRVAQALAEAAAAAPAMGAAVWVIVSAALPTLLSEGVRNLHQILEIAADIAAELEPIASPSLISALEQAAEPGATRRATTTRRLLKLLRS